MEIKVNERRDRNVHLFGALSSGDIFQKMDQCTGEVNKGGTYYMKMKRYRPEQLTKHGNEELANTVSLKVGQQSYVRDTDKVRVPDCALLDITDTLDC